MGTLSPTAHGNFYILDFYNFIQNKILSSAWSSVYWLPQQLLEKDFGVLALTSNGFFAYRIILEWSGFERTLKIIYFQPPATDRDIFR